MTGRSVLVLDSAGGAPPVVERLHRLGYRALRAKSPQEALGLLEDPRHAVGAALIPPDLAVADWPAALAALRSRGPLACVAAGPRPEGAARAALRAAGIELALWEPYTDAALRFQVNRALAGLAGWCPRRARRAPVALPVRVLGRGPVKTCRLYTLSTAGAFVETSRPLPRGAALRLELLLPAGELQVAARVAYANVPGNLRRANLPLGMALTFAALPSRAERAIRGCVAAAERALGVAESRRWIPRWLGGGSR